MSNSFQNLNLSFDSTDEASVAFAVIIHNWDLFPFKCKRQAGSEEQTFPEVAVASLKNQGNKEGAIVDMWVQKESRCLGSNLNKVWITALFSDRIPEGGL